MKILLKILVAPFALALSLLAALLVFLFDICAFLLTIASVILAVLGIALFFTPTPIGGIVFLFLAFLLSPYGLQAAAGSLLWALDGGKSGRRQIRSVSVSGKLNSLGSCWPEVGEVWTGRPFFIEGRDDFWLPQLCCSAMRAKAKRLPRPSGIVWTMVKTRKKQKAESISPLMSATLPPWRTSFFWRKPAMPP